MTTETIVYPDFSDTSTRSGDPDFVQSPTDPRAEVDNDLPEDAETTDPDAPYGRKADGTPYKVSSVRRAILANNRTRGRREYKAPGKTASKKATTTAGIGYREGVIGLLAIPRVILGMLGQRSRPLALDALTLDHYAPQLADAVANAAASDERIASALDKILAVGPYGELLGAAVAIGTQVAYNHGKIPAAAADQIGILTAEDLVAAAEKKAA